MFVKALNLGKLKGGLEEGMRHVEAGFVGGKPGAFDFHATEAPDVDAAVGAAAPWASPLLQLGHFRRAVMNENSRRHPARTASRLPRRCRENGTQSYRDPGQRLRIPLLQRPYGCASDRL